MMMMTYLLSWAERGGESAGNQSAPILTWWPQWHCIQYIWHQSAPHHQTFLHFIICKTPDYDPKECTKGVGMVLTICTFTFNFQCWVRELFLQVCLTFDFHTVTPMATHSHLLSITAIPKQFHSSDTGFIFWQKGNRFTHLSLWVRRANFLAKYFLCSHHWHIMEWREMESITRHLTSSVIQSPTAFVEAGDLWIMYNFPANICIYLGPLLFVHLYLSMTDTMQLN